MLKEMVKNKEIRIGMIVVSLLAVVGCITGTTVSVLQAQTQTLENKFTIGKVTTEIEETVNETQNQKAPKVTNVGECDCIIRMRVTVSPSDAKISLDLPLEDATDWILEEDGFYYYQGIVEPDESTTELFTTYEWTGKADLSDFEEFDITLYQEAIQVEAVNGEGERISFLEGVYDQDTAEQLWNIYKES